MDKTNICDILMTWTEVIKTANKPESYEVLCKIYGNKVSIFQEKRILSVQML